MVVKTFSVLTTVAVMVALADSSVAEYEAPKLFGPWVVFTFLGIPSVVKMTESVK